jgi:hypothetical protein
MKTMGQREREEVQRADINNRQRERKTATDAKGNQEHSQSSRKERAIE